MCYEGLGLYFCHKKKTINTHVDHINAIWNDYWSMEILKFQNVRMIRCPHFFRVGLKLAWEMMDVNNVMNVFLFELQ